MPRLDPHYPSSLCIKPALTLALVLDALRLLTIFYRVAQRFIALMSI